MWQSVRNASVAGAIVLVRVDFNVPLQGMGAKYNDFRIRASMPTLKYLLKGGARVILATHVGEPSRPDSKSSTKQLVPLIEKACNIEVLHEKSFDSPAIKSRAATLDRKHILLLENMRFHPGEAANDEAFAQSLASCADLYVNDAFGAAHRSHASLVAITTFLPSYAGLLLEREVSVLDSIFSSSEMRPLLCIVGGGKATTKSAFLKTISMRADFIVVGGVLAHSFLASQGVALGKSTVDSASTEFVKSLRFKPGALYIPRDAIVSAMKEKPEHARAAAMSDIKDDEFIMDIGPRSLEDLRSLIAQSRTIVWNGPFGHYEVPEFAKGTFAIADMLEGKQSIIGGGDLTAALGPWIARNAFYHASTGGGAMLEFLGGRRLPGLVALGYYGKETK